MKLKLYQVDAFAGELFNGNPAAVCQLDEWPPDEMLQNIAQENNLSETAFFTKEEDQFRLRWFTPKTEVDLCGHATLATAHVLFEHMNYGDPEIVFISNSGELRVKKDGDLLAMDFPETPLEKEAPPLDLYHSIGILPVEVYKADDYLWILETEEEVRNIKPDFREMAKVDTRGVIVTAPGDEVDFVSRFFAPAFGIDEDPVTGSAHCMLTPYWAKHLDKKELAARQISKRGGEIRCRLRDDGRVEIAGRACTYLEGTINLPAIE